jgi:hypothetical protein
MINALIQILIVAIIIGVIWWVADYLPIPEPLNRIVKVISMVVGIIAVIFLLLKIAGMDFAVLH